MYVLGRDHCTSGGNRTDVFCTTGVDGWPCKGKVHTFIFWEISNFPRIFLLDAYIHYPGDSGSFVGLERNGTFQQVGIASYGWPDVSDPNTCIEWDKIIDIRFNRHKVVWIDQSAHLLAIIKVLEISHFTSRNVIEKNIALAQRTVCCKLELITRNIYS